MWHTPLALNFQRASDGNGSPPRRRGEADFAATQSAMRAGRFIKGHDPANLFPFAMLCLAVNPPSGRAGAIRLPKRYGSLARAKRPCISDEDCGLRGFAAARSAGHFLSSKTAAAEDGLARLRDRQWPESAAVNGGLAIRAGSAPSRMCSRPSNSVRVDSSYCRRNSARPLRPGQRGEALRRSITIFAQGPHPPGAGLEGHLFLTRRKPPPGAWLAVDGGRREGDRGTAASSCCPVASTRFPPGSR